LRAIAEALNGAANVNEALQTTLAQVASLLGLQAGWIWLTDPASGRFYGAAAQHLPPFLQDPVRMSGQSCWCLKAFRSGELTAGNIDVMECSRLRGAVGAAGRAGTRNLRYHASVPLYFGSRPLGVMNVAAPAWRRLTPRELDLLSTIASQVGVAVERARLADENVQMARVEERTRIARELHDTLAQGLTAIGLQIETALSGLPGGSVAAAPLRKALALSGSAMDEARRSIRQLRSAAAAPLPAAIRELTHAFTGETGIRVHVNVIGNVDLPDMAESEVLRITAEALANAGQHAHATEITIALHAGRRRLRLEIADNGRGFRPARRTAGYGITGMRERARALGGRLRIRSDGAGTRVTLLMPLDPGP
jgi:two-component system NarL family sensor kinase